MTTWRITINRSSDDDHTLSYDVWAKREIAPYAVGDGEFVGNSVIGPRETSIEVEYTTLLAGQYYFLVVPRRNYQIGREKVL